jgi:hypothetical protein
MEKYSYIQDLTKNFLHGDLSEMRMQYENAVYTVVDVIYTDDSHYNYDYKFEVNNKTKKVKFISHICDYANQDFELKRQKGFEEAVKSFLFKT